MNKYKNKKRHFHKWSQNWKNGRRSGNIVADLKNGQRCKNMVVDLKKWSKIWLNGCRN